MPAASQLIIKSYTPFKYWSKVVLVSILEVALVWGAFELGYYRSGFDNKDLREKRDSLAKRMDEIDRFNKVLREKNAVLEQSKRIDKAAMTNVDGTIQGLQKEILELKEEVSFYRGIVSPNESKSGIKIASLAVRAVGKSDKGGYRFKLVLTHTRKKKHLVKGSGDMSITGLLAGKTKTLTLSSLTNRRMKNLRLHFKYFQNIEGDIILPKGFEPTSVVINLNPQGRGVSSIHKNYDWADILS